MWVWLRKDFTISEVSHTTLGDRRCLVLDTPLQWFMCLVMLYIPYAAATADKNNVDYNNDYDKKNLHHCVGIVSRACTRANDITAQMESMLATGTSKNSETGLGLMQVNTGHFIFLILAEYVKIVLLIPPNLHLASSEQWCWSGGRGILTELSLCYSIV